MADDFRDQLQEEIGIPLVRTYDPRYDSFELLPSDKVVDIHLFQNNVGREDPYTKKIKTPADCNMTLCGQLGRPLGAKWEWIRFFMEDFQHVEDVRAVLSNLYIDVITGSQTIARRFAVSAMSPVLPKGGKELVSQWIKDGVVVAWPWLQAALPVIGVDWCESFRVSLYADPFHLKEAVRGKVFLGPWLYRPTYDRPHYEDRPEDDVVD